MANKSTFIKLDRNILRWMWYNNGNVFRVFVHLLLIAGAETRVVGTHLLARGDVLTSLESMQQRLNMSKQEVRTALSTLKKTGEITQFKVGRNVVYHVENYDYYQGRSTQKKQDELTRNQHELNTNPTQSSTQFSEPENVGADRVSENSANGELTQLSTPNQHESNTNLTPVKREEIRNKNIYNIYTHSPCARAREAGGDVKDTHENIPQDLPGYGRYGNVRLTPDEYSELCGEFGEDVANGAIDILDGHIKKRGAAFKSECHAVDIREWCVSKYQRLQAEKAALEKITPQKYPLNGGGSYIRMVTRVTGVERALTRPELACVDRWEADGISEDLLTLAYEKTVAKINKPQFAYMDKMLAGWQEKGLSTSGEVDAYFKNPANRLLGGAASDGRLDFELDEIFEKP
jgi:DNA replication protein DnaD